MAPLEAAIEDKFEKIANLLILEVPESQIAAAVGFSVGRISQLKEDPKFKEFFAGKIAAHYEQHKEVNDGWDAVERDALSVVVTALQWSKDPDFALKAAMIANKAQRRGQAAANRPINNDLGARVVLNLNQTFVNQIQSGERQVQKQIEGYSIELDEKGKHEEVLTPVAVEKLLGTKISDDPNVSVHRQIDALFREHAVAK